jgi:hypothetical protein
MADNFQAFIDDSRSKDEFVLAGHIATTEAWAAFSQKWEDILPLATKARNGKWHFKMSEMAMQPVLMSHVPAFYKIIEDHVICSISCRMPANVIKAFGQSIETLHEMLKRNPHDTECRTAFGNVIDRILVHPTGFGEDYEISLYARLAAIQGGIDIFPKVRSNEEIVAAEGLPRGSIPSPMIHH